MARDLPHENRVVGVLGVQVLSVWDSVWEEAGLVEVANHPVPGNIVVGAGTFAVH